MPSGSAILCVLVLSNMSARASPTRDEGKSGAPRCEGIVDDRTWLDCFYGSAQPMRVLLDLHPAPPNQSKPVLTPGAAYTTPAWAVATAVPVSDAVKDETAQ